MSESTTPIPSSSESATPSTSEAAPALEPTLSPAVDIFENADEYRLVADLPGVAADDVALDLEQRTLTLTAARSVSRDGEALSLGRLRDGAYRRVFRIPEQVDGGAIEASFEHGVLQVRLPKSEMSKPRRIAVKGVA